MGAVASQPVSSIPTITDGTGGNCKRKRAEDGPLLDSELLSKTAKRKKHGIRNQEATTLGTRKESCKSQVIASGVR